jgi:hypothetical protein
VSGEGLSRDQITIRSTQARADLETVVDHIQRRKLAAGLADCTVGTAEAVRRALAYMAEAVREGRA